MTAFSRNLFVSCEIEILRYRSHRPDILREGDMNLICIQILSIYLDFNRED